MDHVDYLIVGQGLAGTILGLQLHQRGKRVVIYDQDGPSSSKVAAGLYNPITGRKMVKTWNADNIFPMVEPFYQEMEVRLEASFLHPIGIYRPFVSVEEQNEWHPRTSDPRFAAFIARVTNQSHPSELLDDPFGGLHLKNAGYVDTLNLLTAAKTYFADKGFLRREVFQFDQIEWNNGNLKYGKVTAKGVLVCTGPERSVPNNPFDWIPLQPVKGEILTILCREQIETIFNRGVFIVPVGENKCRVGSTYDWKDLSPTPTAIGKETLVKKLQMIFKGNYEIADHVAGVRPASKDRKPLIGHHPTQKGLSIFNGFGTKGVSLIPFYAKQFIDFLEDGKDLDEQVNIARYYSLYSHSVNGS